jgi:predicted nucleotide-binding protein
VKSFIEGNVRVKTKVLVDEFSGGTLIDKVRKSMWFECDCAVAILSADDLMANQQLNARPNVHFEVGYCMGFFDYRYWHDDDIEPVILIKEDKTALPSDLQGIEYIAYSHENGRGGIKESFGALEQGLERIYASVREYFEE